LCQNQNLNCLDFAHSHASNAQYYYNRETQETVWEEPEGWPGTHKGRSSALGSAAPSAAAGSSAVSGGDGAGHERGGADGFAGDIGDLSDWEQFSDDEGDPYWHNCSTDDSSWFPPPGWEEHLSKRSEAQ
jgi:hypothetical protein